MTNLLTPKDVAKILKISERTLANWRTQGMGPKFLKVNNKSIRYNEKDIEKFISKKN